MSKQSAIGYEDRDVSEYKPSRWTKHKYQLAVLVIGIALWIYAHYMKYYTLIPIANIDMFVSGFLLVMWASRSIVLEFKVRSAVAVFTNMHCTYNEKILNVGGHWRAIRMDGWMCTIADEHFGVKGSGGTAFFPDVAILNAGDSTSIAAYMKWYPEENLYPNLRRAIEQAGLPKPYFFGMVDTEVLAHVPDLEFAIMEIENVNEWCAKLEKMNKDVMGIQEMKKNFWDRIRNRGETVHVHNE